MLTNTIKSSAIRVLATLALAAVPGFASPIYVSNFNFESAVTGLVACGANCFAQNVSIPGWTPLVAGHSGIFAVTGAGTYWTDGAVQAADGPQSAYVFNSLGTVGVTDTLSQVVGPLAVAGWTYVLQVDIGQRLDKSFAGTADVMIGSTQHFVTCPTPTSGLFVTCAASYTAAAQDANQAITIQLNAAGLQGNFDNVRLDSVPEPASFLLIGSALFVLSSLRRRRANS